MATTTPNFGWTVPTSTDLVKDGATAIETLGDAVDASLAALTLRDVSTTTDTFVLTDLRNKFIRYSSTSNVAVTIPLNSSVAFPVGAVVNIIKTGATGTITIAGDGGVTVSSTGATSSSPTITKAFAAASCIKVDTNTWYVIGNIA
jgi:hypothetical protein